jgi:hypothetical protein
VPAPDREPLSSTTAHGFYIEVTQRMSSAFPTTTTPADAQERRALYHSGLKAFEDKALSAQERALPGRNSVRRAAARAGPAIPAFSAAQALAALDVLVTHAACRGTGLGAPDPSRRPDSRSAAAGIPSSRRK